MPGRIVSAWRIDTTPPRRVQIPEHWLEDPQLGKPYAAELPKTTAAAAADKPVARSGGSKAPVAGDKED